MTSSANVSDGKSYAAEISFLNETRQVIENYTVSCWPYINSYILENSPSTGQYEMKNDSIFFTNKEWNESTTNPSEPRLLKNLKTREILNK